MKRHNTKQLVNVDAAHNWQELDAIAAHSFESHVETLIGVNMRKPDFVNQFANRFLSATR